MGIAVKMAIETIKHSFLSHFVVDVDGNICAVEPLDSWPSVEEIIALGKKHRGCVGKFIEQQEMTTAKLQKEIDGLIETVRLGRLGKLKPGANLVKRGRIEWVQDAARRRMKTATLALVRKHPYTIVLVDKDRTIIEALPVQEPPRLPEFRKDVEEHYRGCVVGILPRGNLSAKAFDNWLNRLVREKER